MRLAASLAAFVLLILITYTTLAGESDKLQGTWEITELIAGGEKVPDKEIKGLKFVFDKEKMVFHWPSQEGKDGKLTFSVKLDPKAKPAAVDLTALDGEHKGAVSPGIYELKGDTLRWCQSDSPKAKDRPKDFVSPKDSDLFVFTFKRAK